MVEFFKAPTTEEKIRQQQLLAQQLMQQGAQRSDPDRMVGNRVVRISPVESLAKALQQGIGGYMQGQATEAQDKLDKEKSASIGRILAAGTEKPMPQGVYGAPTVSQQAGGGLNGMIAQSALEDNPYAQALGQQLAMKKIDTDLKANEPITPYQQAELDMQKQRIAQGYASMNQPAQLPATLQVANALADARKRGDQQAVNDILMVSKSLDKGQGMDMGGNIVLLPGASSASSEKASSEGLGKKIGEGVGESLMTKRTAAEDAKTSLVASDEAIKLLDSGVITGTGADYVKGFGKALNTIGFKGGEDEVSNTEAFVALRAGEVGRIIKQFGAGTGLSDADREYAQQMAGGKISLNDKSIRKIMEISNRASRNVIKNYNDELAKVPSSATPYDLSVQEPKANNNLKSKYGLE